MVRPTVRHDAPVNEFDVDLSTGRFILRQTDLFVPDVLPLALTRTYATWDSRSRAFGVGANHPYDIYPTGSHFPYTYMDLNLENSFQVHMIRISKGTGYADAVFRHADTASEFYGAQAAWNGDGWTLTFRDGGKFYFPDSYYAKNSAQGAPTLMEDAEGHRIELRRSKVRNLEELVSPSGYKMQFKYDSSDRIIEVRDDRNDIRKYSYDSSGHIETVADAAHILYRFEYAPLIRQAGYDAWLLTRMLDGDWHTLLENKYLSGQVVDQKLADNEVFHYEYKLNGAEVGETTVTLPSGERKIFSFHSGQLLPRE